MAQQSGSARRALRDLLPATLATGAAGLVVALVVGGTGAAVRSVVGPGRGSSGSAVAELAADPAVGRGGDPAAGVTVRVRPKVPPAIGIVSAFDLVPQPVGAAQAGAEQVVVRGVLLARTSPPEIVAASSPVLAAAVEAPSAVADVVSAPSAAPTPPPDPSKPARRRTKPTAARRTDTVTLASSDRVPLTASDDDDDRRTAERTADPGDRRNGPPDHAPAYGLRSR